MFDERPGDAGSIDLDEFANQLLEQGLQVSPSEVHGCVCGLLAAGAPAEAEWGLARLSEALDLQMHGELAGQVLRLYRMTAAALEDEEFDFYPLLPDDEMAISERTAALAAWCGGFLAGFALPGGAGTSAGESEEVLQDFASIAEAEVDEDAPEEESEESYTELVEYIRFAALNVYLDSRSDGGDGGQAPRGPDAIH